nr:MAG TPA: hypothetical protein [Caudoviricetes sp.]
MLKKGTYLSLHHSATLCSQSPNHSNALPTANSTQQQKTKGKQR